jgi:hypothetical protein
LSAVQVRAENAPVGTPEMAGRVMGVFDIITIGLNTVVVAIGLLLTAVEPVIPPGGDAIITGGRAPVPVVPGVEVPVGIMAGAEGEPVGGMTMFVGTLDMPTGPVTPQLPTAVIVSPINVTLPVNP